MLLDVKKLRGGPYIIAGSMNSGKTKRVVGLAADLVHSPYANGFMVFANSRNVRDGNVLVAGDGALALRYNEVYVADAENPKSVLTQVANREKEVGEQTVLIFDECNLHKPKFVDVVLDLMKQGKLVVAAGLKLDFRGKPFGPMGPLENIARKAEARTGLHLVETLQAYCTAVDAQGNQCGALAGNNLRVIRCENLREASFQGGEVKFHNPRREVVEGFVRAPYYDPTIRVEGSDGDVLYTTFCDEHFGSLPGQGAVEEVIESLQRSRRRDYKELITMFPDKDITDIVAYALEEGKFDIGEGVYRDNRRPGRNYFPQEVRRLIQIGKRRGGKTPEGIFDIYNAIRTQKELSRGELMKEFERVRGIERVMADYVRYGFVSLEGATLTPTNYHEDPRSGTFYRD